MAQTNRDLNKEKNIIELGYRPKDKLDPSRPPKGGSAVLYPTKSSSARKSDKHR